MKTARTSKGLRIVSWVLQVLVGLMFVMAGGQKLAGSFPSPELFARIHDLAEPAGRYFVGVWEVVAGLMLFVPRTVAVGALLVVVAMVGAFVAHAATPLGMMPEFVDPSSAGDATTMPWVASVVFLALGGVILVLRRDQLPRIGSRGGASGG